MTRKSSKKKAKAENANGNSIAEFTKELWEAAVNLRGSIEPADYKRYVLPIIFLRFLSLRYEKRREELERLIADPKSDYFTEDPEVAREFLEDPDEYGSANIFVPPEEARWENIVKQAQADDINDECLNANWFRNLRHARLVVAAWRSQYNHQRPHSALGYRTPYEFAQGDLPVMLGG